MKETKFNPKDISIDQNMRAVPLPDLEKKEEIKLDEISSDINVDDFSIKAAEIGEAALNGKNKPSKRYADLCWSSDIINYKKYRFQ